MIMATAVVVTQPLGLSNLALGSACRASVKPNHLASQLSSRTPLSLSIGSDFRVGQPLGLVGAVRHGENCFSAIRIAFVSMKSSCKNRGFEMRMGMFNLFLNWLPDCAI